MRFVDCAKLRRENIQPNEIATECPYIGLEHIGQESLQFLSVGSSSEVTSTKKKFHAGDILFGKLRPYFRKVAKPNFSGICSTDIWVIQSLEGTDQRFLYYWVASWDFINFVNVASEGTRMPRAKWDVAETHEIPNFSISEQKAIAHILGTLDDKIELNQKMNETLEEIAKAIFNSWFVDFDPVRAKMEGRPTGLADDLSALFPDTLVDSELGEIPKGWHQESIYVFCTVEYGAPFKSKLFNEEGRGIPLVRIRDLSKGKSSVFTEEIHPKGQIIKAGDLVVGMDGEFRCCFWTGVDSWMNQRVCKFVPKKGVPSAFVWFALEKPLHFIESTEVATTVIHLGKGDIDEFKFVKSSDMLLEKFAEITNSILERIIILNKESEALSELRDILLPKLISGELQIPDAEKFIKEAGL